MSHDGAESQQRGAARSATTYKYRNLVHTNMIRLMKRNQKQYYLDLTECSSDSTRFYLGEVVS